MGRYLLFLLGCLGCGGLLGVILAAGGAGDSAVFDIIFIIFGGMIAFFVYGFSKTETTIAPPPPTDVPKNKITAKEQDMIDDYWGTI